MLPVSVGASIVYPNMEEVCKVTDCSVIYQPEAVSSFTVIDKIKATFPEEPRMVEIAWCESRHRQLVNGKPLISRTSDVGLMQINQVHWKEAKSRGLDIFYNEDDNIRMGRIVYEKQGVKAWTCYDIVSRQSV